MTNWDKADIRDVVAMREWQSLRRSFVGTWKHTPAANVAKLRSFVGTMTCRRRLRIVHNYLTGSAFRIGIVSHPDIDALLAEVRDARRRSR